MLPDKNEQYATKEYWDRRYTEEGSDSTYEWFKGYDGEFRNLLDRYLPKKNARICMLGCGNSALSQDMWEAGYQDIHNIDYSEIVIDNMNRRFPHMTCPLRLWIQADIRDLPLEDGSFDAVIDKGTMDALMAAEQSVWEPSEEVVRNCKMEVDEVCRILKPDGLFLYLTFGQPHFRRRHLERPGWKLDIETLGESFHYFLYILKRHV